MLCDYIDLDFSQVKVEQRVIKGGKWMGESVQPVFRLGRVPIVQKVIMKQGTAHQLFHAEFNKSEFFRDEVTKISYRKAVF